MKLKRIALSFVALALSVSAFAAHNLKNSSITIPGGDIKPHGIFTISSDKMMTDVYYHVTCVIKDKNNANNKVYIKKDGTFGGAINGSWAGYQFMLDGVDNTLELYDISNSTPITLTNLDNDDTVTVESCVITPEVTW